MEDCIFCKIIKKEIPCYKIFENEDVLAFLDIAKDVEGHTLVIPKKHFKNVLDIDKETLAKVMEGVQIVSKHYLKCGYDGINLINANNAEAEQTVNHLHIHVIPRKQKDNLKVFPKFNGIDKDLEEICEKLKIQ